MDYIVEYQINAYGEWINSVAKFESLDKAARIADEISKNPWAKFIRLISEEKLNEEEKTLPKQGFS